MRQSWDRYFMEIAEQVSKRGTCNRKQVGAILVKNKRIISTGYNGSIPGQPHCDDPEVYYECPDCGKKVSQENAWKMKDEKVFATVGYNTEIGRLITSGYPEEEPIPLCNCKLLVGLFMKPKFGDHIIEHEKCIRTVHAEANAVAQAARLGISTEGTTLYCNTFCCWTCFKLVASAGITRIVYKDDYPSEEAGRVRQTAIDCKIKLEKLEVE